MSNNPRDTQFSILVVQELAGSYGSGEWIVETREEKTMTEEEMLV
jgi:hypothetical protein